MIGEGSDFGLILGIVILLIIFIAGDGHKSLVNSIFKLINRLPEGVLKWYYRYRGALYALLMVVFVVYLIKWY